MLPFFKKAYAGSFYDSGGGAIGHLSHEVPSPFGVESSNGCSSELAVDELRLFVLLGTV